MIKWTYNALYIIPERIDPIIENMEVTSILKGLNPTWDSFETMQKLSKISLRIVSELNSAFARMVADNAETN